jgi:hypothetical protein
MSQRDSGYERKANDLYETPAWVTRALIPHIRRDIRLIWEPACGSGKMVRELCDGLDCLVYGSDISGKHPVDFLQSCDNAEAIITNPPYGLADEFIQRGLTATARDQGMVAMLLRTDFDHAQTRQHLFQSKQFAKKLVLLRRIRWFENTTGSPSYNHAWFIWDWKHQGPPTLAYGGLECR